MREQLVDYTILYAEDEPRIRDEVAQNIQTYFKTVYLASDGEEAWRHYNNHKPDVLLLDIHMPKIDGLSLCKMVRETDKTVRVLMLTAFTDSDLLIDAVELDITRYLVKPVKPRQFKEALDKVAAELADLHADLTRLGDDCVWNGAAQTLYLGEKEAELSVKERRLLALLIKHCGRCVDFEEIMVHVWDNAYETDISRDSVKTQVNYLRKKLPAGLIQNVYGRGYLLQPA